MTLHDVSLRDKFDLAKERVFLTGAQAVIRMLLMQRERDRRAGLKTAGFVSGYRGSPLGGLDLQLWKAKAELAASDIAFTPGLNEELAATAVWGSQQTELLGEGKFDGVFGLWYGKGPGVDRSGDVFRHANLAGSSRHGGALALMGDDHTAESSTNAHATEFLFVDTMIPILNPAGVQELMDFGLLGYGLSRFAGTWTAVKCVKDNIESTASVDASLERLRIVLPDFDVPAGGLNIRHELNQLGQEERLHEWKRAAAASFIRVNDINRIVWSGGQSPKLGIITVGKSYLDVREALAELGIDEAQAARIGLRLFKVGCPWPLDLEHIRDFARGLEMIVVVEEKRSLIEVQVREDLYGTSMQPAVVGKRDERGDWLFPAKGALDPNDIAIAVGERVLRVLGHSDEIAARVSGLRQRQAMLAETTDVASRTPFFCSGCPHNSSTAVPEGSVAGAGIGCHFMALWMDRSTHGFTAMGGEGAQWVGQAPFSQREHFFQNLGDGTYNHSGSLAIRFALSAGVNMTYKLLYNDAVAMTGGQPHEGNLTLPMIADQIRAEGVKRIAVVSDDPDRYKEAGISFPPGSTIHHRRDMDAVQRDLREGKGVSVLIYDQTCAAEKRRRRKRGLMPDPDRRVIINELVCEGCGDCGVKSNCVSIQPVETEWGRKRRIDQSSCNKDFSCAEGFCPSFVTVHGAKLKRAEGTAGGIDPLEGVPEPKLPSLDRGWSAIIDGVGGTGVVTVGAILGMAAHLEGRGSGAIDMAGLAQKGGAVFSHLRIAASPADIHAIRVSAGKADLILGCDLVVSGAKKVLAAVRENHTVFVANTAEVMPGDFARNADFSLPTERLKRAIADAAGETHAHFVDATAAATALFGASLGQNMFMLGFGYQHGGVPVSAEAIEAAIRLNGEAVDMNVAAFRWGRRAAHEPAFVAAQTAPKELRQAPPAESFEEAVRRRADFLAAYQDQAYARRFLNRIERLATAEKRAAPQSDAVAWAAARGLFKLMAIKDEYEVARLYTDGSFAAQLEREFGGYERLEFHLAPPVLARRDAKGHLRKRRFGPWMMRGFGLLARGKRLRGTWLDPFGYMAERRAEKADLARFEGDLDRIEAALAGPDAALRLEPLAALASWPMLVRGFGHVKDANREKAEGERARLLARLDARTDTALPAQLEAAE